MKKLSNGFLIFLSIIVIIGYIGYKTIDKVLKEHDKKMIYAMQSKAEYQAKRCYLEGVCKGKIYISFLYDKGYINELVNPVTKEVIDPKTPITYNNDAITIEWLN